MKIGKEQERLGFTELLTHKHEGDMRRQQQRSHQYSGTLFPDETQQAIALSTITYLIVILDEIDEGRWRLSGTFHTPNFTGLRGTFPLISKAFRQRPRHPLFGFFSKILVPGVGFTAGHDVDGIVQIVIPLPGEQRHAAVLLTRMKKHHVAAVFGGQMHRPVGNGSANAGGDLN